MKQGIPPTPSDTEDQCADQAGRQCCREAQGCSRARTIRHQAMATGALCTRMKGGGLDSRN